MAPMTSMLERCARAAGEERSLWGVRVHARGDARFEVYRFTPDGAAGEMSEKHCFESCGAADKALMQMRETAGARAVLLLLREPSGEMARAMGKKYTELEDHDFGKTPPRVYPQDMPAIFTAAIDAALSETE